MTLLARACELRDLQSCKVRALLLIEGRVVARDPRLGETELQRSCDGGFGDACEALGVTLLKRAGGTEMARGLALLETGCAASAGACAVLASVLMNGEHGVPAEPHRAMEAAKRSCQAEDPDGCLMVAIGMLNGRGIEKNERGAVMLFEAACEHGNAMACFNLGLCHAEGWGVSRDATKAQHLYARACRVGVKAACDKIDEPASPSRAAPAP